MSDQQDTATGTTILRSDLLLRLGLDAGADDHAVQSRREQIVAYLGQAPGDIRVWADRRQLEVDRIFALLTGPQSDLGSGTSSSGPSTPAGQTPAARASAAQTTAAQAAAARAGVARAPRRGATPRALLGVVAVLVTIGVVVGVYWMGKPSTPQSASPAAQGGTSQSAAPVDQAKLTALTKKVEADPKDITSLQAIADLHFAANDWSSARAAAQRVLDVDPKNEMGLVTYGAAAYNDGDQAAAETAWQTGVELYPRNAELHYDLGFLYMVSGRMDQMRTSWAKVVELAPGSELAKAVQSQVGAVTNPSGTPTK